MLFIIIHFLITLDALGRGFLSGEMPISLSISAIILVLMPQLLATFFWHRLCTFMEHTVHMMLFIIKSFSYTLYILSLAINTVTIKNQQNISFEFGISHFYKIVNCVFIESRQYIVKYFVILK